MNELKKVIDQALASNPNRVIQAQRVLDAVQELFDRELKRLEHFEAAHCGLFAIDQNPECRDIEWIRKNAFQITTIKNT